MLAKEKQRLGQMQQQLDTLEVEKAKTANRASSLLSFLGIGSSKQQKQQEQQQQEEPQQRPAAGSGWQSVFGKRSSQQQQQQPAQAASAPTPSSSSSSSGSKVLLQAWESLGQQLLRLEGQLNEQQSRTERQRISVQRLQQKVRDLILMLACFNQQPQ
jgi:hypothetical protein